MEREYRKGMAQLQGQYGQAQWTFQEPATGLHLCLVGCCVHGE